MIRPRIAVDLFTGAGGWFLRLLQARLRPPIGYMGGKAGLADTLLEAQGLAPGVGCDALVLCDGGPWGLVWQALSDPETARAVATVLYGWRHEDPTALWRRLAAAPPPAELMERAATVLWVQGRSANNTPIWWEDARKCWEQQGDDRLPYRAQETHGSWMMPSGPSIDGRIANIGAARPRDTAGEPVVGEPGSWMMATGNGKLDGRTTAKERGIWGRSQPGRQSGLRSTATVARRIDAIADAIARFIALARGNAFTKPVLVEDGRWKTAGYGHVSDSGRARGFKEQLRTEMLARGVDRIAAVPLPPLSVVHGDVVDALALLPEDLTDCWVYIDPPYVDCTHYACECPRERVLEIARDLDRRGAHVTVSEAVPLGGASELGGWHTLEITGARRGQQWKARRVKREWITCNRPIGLRLPEQQPMFFHAAVDSTDRSA